MSLYLKKVEAVQFVITDEQKELIRMRKPVFFEGYPVKHVGGEQYITLIQQGENLLKIQTPQWLVKHPDGILQILWPDQFASVFIKGSDADAIHIGHDPFKAPKTYSQPNTIL